MAEESFQEKTEQPTPRKRDEARKKGQVARSAELSSVAILMVGLLAMTWFGSTMFTAMSGMMIESFTEGMAIKLDPLTVQPYLVGWTLDFVGIVAPIIGLLGLTAVVINIARVGILFTGKPLMPKGDRISPLAGIKRIISPRGLVELAKGLFKVALVALMTYATLIWESQQLLRLADMGVGQLYDIGGDMILDLGFRIVAALLILAILDYAFQRWDYEKNLKMTRQEIKDEVKQHEGDPHIRARIKSIQRETAQRRMMSDVAESDVVVTNPTHIAVALRYNPESMAAPIVVAKGQRLVAERIKELARLAGVTVVENKPLARSLFKAVKVGREIPAELFKATAEVLAFVFQLKLKRRGEEVSA